MAEESSKSKTASEDLLLAIFAMLLVGNMLQNIQAWAQEELGISVGGTYLVASAGLSDETTLGTHVNAPNGATFYDAAGEPDTELGTFVPGTSLTVVGGPEVVGGERWWYVEDAQTGNSFGWVQEGLLVREGVGGFGADTRAGNRARALLDADLWETPGSLVRVGSMKMGEWGVLDRGPLEAVGSSWWYFDRDDTDEDGWVPAAALVLSSETGWYDGSWVQAVRTVDMYERAGGGVVVGFLDTEEQARVRGGPSEMGGLYWWYVERDDGTLGWVEEGALEDGGVTGFARGALATGVIVGAIITILLLGAIIYATIRTNQIRARETARIRAALPKAMPDKHNERWEKVQEHVASSNPNDWRLAIIEADIMLDELITRMGYQGATLGDRLKQATRGDIESIDEAWEAHKVRNQIAHSGSDFILTQREAKRVIDMYAKVFTELKYI